MSSKPQIDVLIVDSSPVRRRTMQYLLAQSGIDDVREAGDMTEAQHILQEHSYRLLIVDWSETSGQALDLVEWARRTENGAGTLVLIISSHGSRSHVTEAIRAGADDYLLKPYAAEVFQLKVQALLKGS